ncbi:copper amine oxidase N-terminal domain-containing protein [Paenibacillus sp. alder61]|uniref:copper amine oxidase N-terminal domain-containing protein n=1 Tax=Paenibacillus sp. alder61 TaxID=2862948 RepID=UPI001CD4FB1C|nr:copper amine oxidase N-terminal domain-containing protein [Paenibacillus sp. alder61]MCA1293148.1 copper amine oxidase N-terminal domain-containing protein [Paenibacillus sp. alder61]
MKKWMAASVVLALLAAGGTNVHAAAQQASPQLVIKGTPVKSDAAPVIKSGRVLVPIRVVTEMLGGKVTWNTPEQTVSLRKWTDTIQLTLDKQTAVINRPGESKPETRQLEAPARLVNGRIYVPLRFVSEAFGYPVDWDGTTARVKSPLSMKEQEILASGSLEDARQLVKKQLLSGTVRYKHEALVYSYESEYRETTFLFPEGEALRGYMIQGDTIMRFEFKEDFPVAVWQARVKEGDKTTSILQGHWTKAIGENPSIKKAFFTYTSGGWGDSFNEETGWIDPQGEYSQLGYKRLVGGEAETAHGTIAYAQTHEKRQETVKFNKTGGAGNP